ncbi:hypothetical protein JTE90_016245 [Oedothorax gibbosus]|uniref:Uncharacterized protein n=1 Tax=Oedothorax gibbosus TaxID=931172 RepID=A0AAV6VS69_9ARAC|nr:hypothetical protein JTE90_016245 [Oedothorax gibbosus]
MNKTVAIIKTTTKRTVTIIKTTTKRTVTTIMTTVNKTINAFNATTTIKCLGSAHEDQSMRTWGYNDPDFIKITVVKAITYIKTDGRKTITTIKAAV